MEGKGEVLYRIVPWDDSVLDDLGQKEPAGPLYSIECIEGSIRHLHFPHCETCKDKGKLTVAHVTGGVAIIQPLTVTNTHVIIKIQNLSCFGLTQRCSGSPIKAQVLLFYKKMTDHRINKLHIHLLPANVPVKEVQKQHESYMYIETTSNCDLSPGKKYRPCCKSTDHEYAPKPEVVKFHRDYGPNFHPTFEVSLNFEATEVTLILLDKRGKPVWTPPEVLLTGTARASLRLDSTGADFVDNHREELIQRLPSVMEIADRLIGKEMISNEMYSSIKMKETPQDKMRELYMCLDSGGTSVKAEFYKILREKASYIVDDLSQA
ncbi:NACHT, LRR and PYD domains-containing protein 1b allele 2-like [Clarias gariepinus]|uniref:NACHT, LRR and PYD domains-containing protein 1b allele 2-like n=1 Tax=Clarias gariepinus TaxID=13013 RepID=UPI00234D0BCE|nr:NACHT, LRR and PYD domains-containing protein 1b allele 2-like [Clarias gariepinus]